MRLLSPLRPLFASVFLNKPLINSSMSLRDLRRAAARRISQLMAKVLNQGCNTADGRLRPRPKGLSEQPQLGVGSLCNVKTLLQEAALICGCSESQRDRGIDQRFPKEPKETYR